MAIPLIYNLRSLRARWTSTVVAVLGIAGTVGVFVAMLSLARGFEAPLVASGSPRNAIVWRAGRTPVKIVAGRTFQPGLTELLVGRNVAASYVGLELGKTVKFGGGTWTV